MKLTSNAQGASASVKTALPEPARTLEAAWQPRPQKLVDWRPAGDWLVNIRIRTHLHRNTAGKG